MRAANFHEQFYVVPRRQAEFRELGLDGLEIFRHPDIRPWRSLSDRENCTLVAELSGDKRIFWHIKRYAAASGAAPVDKKEVGGIRLLQDANIPTVT